MAKLPPTHSTPLSRLNPFMPYFELRLDLSSCQSVTIYPSRPWFGRHPLAMPDAEADETTSPADGAPSAVGKPGTRAGNPRAIG